MDFFSDKEFVTINGKPVRKIYGGFGDGQPCILAKQVAELHGYEVREINQLVNNNLEWFDEGIDLIDLKKAIAFDNSSETCSECDLDILIELGFYANAQAVGGAKYIYLFSQQGYVLFCKFLRSDMSKQIYKMVVREYFGTEASAGWFDRLPKFIQSDDDRSDRGFIYVIANHNGKVKIGKSRKPSIRVQSIQTQGGFRTNKIFVSEKIAGYASAETKLHRCFRNRRFVGEWFRIGFEEAVAECRKIVGGFKSKEKRRSSSDDGASERKASHRRESDMLVPETPEKLYTDTKPEALSDVPKKYRGWSVNRRGKNGKGEPIFNLARNVGGKRRQKYLGIWNREKADRIIDGMNRQYGKGAQAEACEN